MVAITGANRSDAAMRITDVLCGLAKEIKNKANAITKNTAEPSRAPPKGRTSSFEKPPVRGRRDNVFSILILYLLCGRNVKTVLRKVRASCKPRTPFNLQEN